MGLFGRKKDAAPRGVPPEVERLLATIDRAFFDKYRESLEAKDQTRLRTALSLREEATRAKQGDPAYYAYGKHNELVLLSHHIGDGLAARAAGLEALAPERRDALRAFAQEIQPLQGNGIDAYAETLEMMIPLAESYEEALAYSEELCGHLPNGQAGAAAEKRHGEIQRLQRDTSGRWADGQRAMSRTFYSRVSAAQDAGQYAAGMSVLHCYLTNSERAGYDLGYEEYVDALDDFTVLTMMYFQALAAKGAQYERQRGRIPGFDMAHEIGILFENPAQMLADFMPDCLPKDRAMFESIYRTWKGLPFPVAEGAMAALDKIF